jgi:hypothetical protein
MCAYRVIMSSPVYRVIRETGVPTCSASCRVKREIGEKGAMWTDWGPTSYGPSRSSGLSRAAILREYFEPDERKAACGEFFKYEQL